MVQSTSLGQIQSLGHRFADGADGDLKLLCVVSHQALDLCPSAETAGVLGSHFQVAWDPAPHTQPTIHVSTKPKMGCRWPRDGASVLPWEGGTEFLDQKGSS